MDMMETEERKEDTHFFHERFLRVERIGFLVDEIARIDIWAQDKKRGNKLIRFCS